MISYVCVIPRENAIGGETYHVRELEDSAYKNVSSPSNLYTALFNAISVKLSARFFLQMEARLL